MLYSLRNMETLNAEFDNCGRSEPHTETTVASYQEPPSFLGARQSVNTSVFKCIYSNMPYCCWVDEGDGGDGGEKGFC